MKPTVSVLMPVYNREQMVKVAIQSIQSQTFQDWELIILDDASTDRTLDVCRKIENEDSRIVVHKNPANAGCGESRNRLLKLAKGEYIAMQDSDDISMPDRFQLEVEVLKKDPEVGLVSGVAELIDDDGKVFEYFPQSPYEGNQYPQDLKELVKRLLLGKSKVVVSCCMFRRTLLSEMSNPFGGFRFTDDRYFFLQAAHLARIWGIQRVLIQMRRGKNHSHVWKDTLAGIRERRKCIDTIYQQHREDEKRLISLLTYRKALSVAMVIEARYFGGFRGWPHLLRALIYDPANATAWKSGFKFLSRGLKRLVG